MKQHIIKQKIDNVKLRILVTINEQCIVSIPTPFSICTSSHSLNTPLIVQRYGSVKSSIPSCKLLHS